MAMLSVLCCHPGDLSAGDRTGACPGLMDSLLGPPLADIHKDPGLRPAQVASSGRHTWASCSWTRGGAGACEGGGGDDSACYRQISLWLRLRGLQLDERSRALGDHFLQQVIIWAKSGACQAQLAGSACSPCPRLLLPWLPGHLCAMKTQRHAPRDLDCCCSLSKLCCPVVLSQRNFPELPLSAPPLVQDPLPLPLLMEHSL